MAATHTQTTWNGKTVHVIEADLSSVSVVDIGASSVNDSPYYGVNGTFFTGGALLGVAMNNGSAVRTGGSATASACSVATKRGTMFHFDPPIGTTFLDVAPVQNYSDYSGASSSNVKWAIGGYSLFLGSTLTSTQYYANINGNGSVSSCTNAVANTENAFRLGPTTATQRTAIGYKAGSKIVLAVFQSETAYEVRAFMLSQSCTKGVMLDGGGSSQLCWRNSNGTVGKYDPSGENRAVYSCVKVEF